MSAKCLCFRFAATSFYGCSPHFFSAGQTNCEPTAPSGPFTLRFDGAVVRFDETLYQRQAQSQAAVRPRLRAIRLQESFEHEGKKVRPNALPLVFNSHDGVGALNFALDSHLPAVG